MGVKSEAEGEEVGEQGQAKIKRLLNIFYQRRKQLNLFKNEPLGGVCSTEMTTRDKGEEKNKRKLKVGAEIGEQSEEIITRESLRSSRATDHTVLTHRWVFWNLFTSSMAPRVGLLFEVLLLEKALFLQTNQKTRGIYLKRV